MFIDTSKKGIVIGSKGNTIKSLRRDCGGIQIKFVDVDGWVEVKLSLQESNGRLIGRKHKLSSC